MGVKRDREPFIYSDELNYFLTRFKNVQAGIIQNDGASTNTVSSEVKQPRKLSSKETQHNLVNAQDEEGKDSVKETFAIEENYPTISQKEEKQRIKDVEREFEVLAEKAFMKIRQHADILINLLILMLVSGMEELTMKSIKFMKKAFFLEYSDAEAVTFFKGKIQQARKTVTMRKFDNLAHLYNAYKKG